jgi:hypothetical protein
VYAFSYLLAYSRRQYVRFVEAQDFVTTIREHVRAFEIHVVLQRLVSPRITADRSILYLTGICTYLLKTHLQQGIAGLGPRPAIPIGKGV